MTNRDQLERAIAALEEQRAILGDNIVDASVGALREQLSALESAATLAASTPYIMTVLVAQTDKDLPSDTWATLSTTGTEHGGRVVQQTPQRLTMVFGATSSSLDMVESAVWVALALRKVVPLRISLHTDYVTADNDDVLKQLVDPAYSLIRRAKLGQILLAHQTYHRVRGVFQVIPLDGFADSKSEMIYLVEDAKPRAFRMPVHSFEGIETRMIGRDAELKQLQDALETVRHEVRCRCITVVGVIGVGKSRLLYELDKWMELVPDEFWYFMSRASQEITTVPYGLMRQILCYRFAINDHDPPEVAREKLVDGILQFMGADRLEEAHIIGHLLGFDFGDSPYLMGVRGDITQTRETAFEATARFFKAVATTDEAPVVMVLEDLHWCDRSTLDLLEYIGHFCQNVPLMILAATQPSLFDIYPEWGTDKSIHTIIELSSLSETEACELFDEIFQKADYVEPQLRHEIVARVAGNPYHLEQLIKFLIEEGMVVPGVQEWRLDHDQLSSLQLPNTLTDVILGRLYSLPSEDRITLQRAAVVGYVFWDRAIEHLDQNEPSQHIDTRASLRSLVQRDMIRLQPTSAFASANEYMFQQEMLHEVSYDSLRQQIRHRYHIQLAQWFIGRSMEQVGEHAGLIAFHFAKAGEINRAVKWYGLAALQAKDAYSPEIAIRYYEQALMLLPENNDDMQLQIRLYEGFGQVLDSQARYMDAVSAYTAVCIAAERSGDQLAQIRAWNALARLQISQDDAAEARYCAERAVNIAEAAVPAGRAELAQSWITLGTVHFSLDQAETALEWASKAKTLTEELADEALQARALNLAGIASGLLGNLVTASHDLEKTVELARQVEDQITEAQALNNLAEVTRRLGDLEKAILFHEEAVSIARDLKLHRDVVGYVSNLALTLALSGQFDEALFHLRQVLAAIGDGGWWGLVGTYRAMAIALLGVNDVAGARQSAQKAMEWARRHDDNGWDLGIAWQVLGHVARQDSIEVDGVCYTARQCFEQSRDALTWHHKLGDLAETLRLWALHELSYGELDMARELRSAACEIYTQLDATGWLEAIDNGDLARL